MNNHETCVGQSTGLSRRTFGKLVTAACGAMAVGNSVAAGERNDPTNEKFRENTYLPVRAKDGYGEYNLWGTLREVVVGTPEGAMFPNDVSSLLESHGDVLHPPVLEALKSGTDKRLLKDILPDAYDGLMEETEAIVKAYEAHGVEVHLPRLATEGEQKLNWGVGGRWQVFAAEPLWVVGRMVFENQWRNDISRSQVMAVRDLHQPYIDADPNVLYFNAPTTNPDTMDYVYEGGDVLNLGDGNVIIATGHSSTNRKGADWMARILRLDGYTPHIIDLPNVGIHHLFAVMCLAGPRLAIVYRPVLVDGIPKPIKDYEFIDITEEEAAWGGACIVALDSKRCLLPSNMTRIADELAKRGVEPVLVDFEAAAFWGGAIRCATNIIRRDIA